MDQKISCRAVPHPHVELININVNFNQWSAGAAILSYAVLIN
jgi:hypothetical protein